MKYCPSCQTNYRDESLQFCLQDGTRLLGSSGEGSRTATEAFGETETVVRQARIVPAWEQSQVTRLAAVQPAVPKKSNAPKAIILTLLALFLFFAALAGIGFLLVNQLSKVEVSSGNTNKIRFPSPSPTSKMTPNTNKEQKKTPGNRAGELNNKVVQKNISIGGEEFKACDYLLGSGLYGKWKQLGGEKGSLGCPVTDETEAGRSPKGTTGRMTKFKKGDGGYIVWHGSGPFSGTAFEVSGCMFKIYSSLGATASWLGFPVRDGYTTPTGARQDFEGGYILWDAKTYRCQAYGNN